jgi:hypothetical protein
MPAPLRCDATRCVPLKAVDAAARRRSELQREHTEAVRAQQEAFELRKQELAQELAREQVRQAGVVWGAWVG